MADGEENRGSGVSVDDPYRLAPSHPAIGAASETMLIARVYGERDKDWFDDGRTCHPNKIVEQRIRLPSGQIRKIFFDESALDYSVPMPEELRELFQRAAANQPVPDTRLVSRFPLIEVKATTAAEAGRIVAKHLSDAKAQGWNMVMGRPFVDGWRNDYDLVRGTEKTVMSFDMRPALVADSRMNLMLLTAFDSAEAVEKVAARMEAMKNSHNIADVDLRRLLAFGATGAIVGGIIGLLLYHSFLGTIALGVAGFFVTLAVS